MFNGELRGEQQQAADVLLAHDNGILSATTAFGKTVIGAHCIANRKVNTLILVHRTNLLSQWVERLNGFLIINEEPIIELTPKGRKRKKAIIGQIGGGKNNPSGIIDVAVMQSLVSGDEVKELVRNYGMVIVDECHHVSAFSFEQILKTVNAKYVYGLTERTKHVKYLESQLKSRIKNVIALTGGETQKKSRTTLQTVANIAEDEPFVLVATGKYVGEGFDMPTSEESVMRIENMDIAGELLRSI